MLAFGFADINTDVFLVLLAAAALVGQLLLCFKVKRVGLRLIPVFLFLLLTIVFMVLVFVFEGWDSLGYLLLALCAAVLLGVCCLGWAIFGITKLVKKKSANRVNRE